MDGTACVGGPGNDEQVTVVTIVVIIVVTVVIVVFKIIIVLAGLVIKCINILLCSTCAASMTLS